MGLFTDEQIALFGAGVIRVAVLAEMRFASGTMRVWNGDIPLQSGGHEWSPMKGAGNIDGIDMLADGTVGGTMMTVSGLPGEPDFIGKVAQSSSEVFQREVVFYLQHFDDLWQTIGGPVFLSLGLMQPPEGSRSEMSDDAGAQQGVTIEVLSAFTNRARPANAMLSDRDQQRRHAGDRMLEFKARVASGYPTNYPAR
jgi:hypothetical protein